MTRTELNKTSKKRVSAIGFGTPITNICAGKGNPSRYSYFVRVIGNDVEHTDKRGKFGRTKMDVIYVGWLSTEECEELFAPVHRVLFPESYNKSDTK